MNKARKMQLFLFTSKTRGQAYPSTNGSSVSHLGFVA
jgi:hypothetical protein